MKLNISSTLFNILIIFLLLTLFCVNFFFQESYSIVGICLLVTSIIVGLLSIVFFNYLNQQKLKSFHNIVMSMKSESVDNRLISTSDKTLQLFYDELYKRQTEVKVAEQAIKNLIDDTFQSAIIIESEGVDNSPLLVSLGTLQDKLAKIRETEGKRTWINEGLNKLSELLRKNHNNIAELCTEILPLLVKHLGVNQGGIFVVKTEKNETYLELNACYAYNRKKYLNKRVNIGEGLVGAAYLEKDLIYLETVPSDYLAITSGLGDAPPKSILIMPLLYNNEVYGVLEMASFTVFDSYKIEFIRKITEGIAAAIQNLDIKERTQKLLEDSQMRTEQMVSQEEELRQNMEELQSTQEAMVRKDAEIKLMEEAEKVKLAKVLNELEYSKNLMNKVIDELPERIFLKDEEGRFMLINKEQSTFFNRPKEEMIGKSDFDFFELELATEYRNAELEVINKRLPVKIYEDGIDGRGNANIAYSVKLPFQFPNSNKFGILGYQVDVTEVKMLERKLKEMEAANKTVQHASDTLGKA